MKDAVIKNMVNRFLSWKLPEDFNPDAGISFKAARNEGTPYASKHEPTGTNLFDAVQAEAMIRHMIGGVVVRFDEQYCPGHVAEPGNLKVCKLCGIHIDSLRQ